MTKTLSDELSDPHEPGISDPEELLQVFGKTYLTPKGLARRLGVTPRTLARWDDARTGPPRIKHGNMVLYDEAKLPIWLESMERQPLTSRKTQRA